MMHTKLLRLLALLFAVSLVAAACGGSDDGSDNAGGDAETEESAGDSDDGGDDDGGDEEVTVSQVALLALFRELANSSAVVTTPFLVSASLTPTADSVASISTSVAS